MGKAFHALKAGLKSTQTTIAAVLTAVATILNMLALALDGNPETNPDWDLVVMAIAVVWGFLVSRDADVTSEKSNGGG